MGRSALVCNAGTVRDVDILVPSPPDKRPAAARQREASVTTSTNRYRTQESTFSIYMDGYAVEGGGSTCLTVGGNGPAPRADSSARRQLETNEGRGAGWQARGQRAALQHRWAVAEQLAPSAMLIPSTAMWTEATAADRRSDIGRGVGLFTGNKIPPSSGIPYTPIVPVHAHRHL